MGNPNPDALRGGGSPSLSTAEGGNNYFPHGGYDTQTGERVDADGFCGLPDPIDNMREMGLSSRTFCDNSQKYFYETPSREGPKCPGLQLD